MLANDDVVVAPLLTLFFLYPSDSGRQCWCFGSNGLQALGQRELVFLVECLPEEKTLPRDLFTLCLNIYQEAQRGRRRLRATRPAGEKPRLQNPYLLFQGSSWRSWIM